MSECNVKKNSERCNCTYAGCARHGICCECVAYHRKNRELPACYFSAEAERGYDRSIENFISTVRKRGA